MSTQNFDWWFLIFTKIENIIEKTNEELRLSLSWNRLILTFLTGTKSKTDVSSYTVVLYMSRIYSQQHLKVLTWSEQKESCPRIGSKLCLYLHRLRSRVSVDKQRTRRPRDNN